MDQTPNSHDEELELFLSRELTATSVLFHAMQYLESVDGRPPGLSTILEQCSSDALIIPVAKQCSLHHVRGHLTMNWLLGNPNWWLVRSRNYEQTNCSQPSAAENMSECLSEAILRSATAMAHRASCLSSQLLC